MLNFAQYFAFLLAAPLVVCALCSSGCAPATAREEVVDDDDDNDDNDNDNDNDDNDNDDSGGDSDSDSDADTDSDADSDSDADTDSDTDTDTDADGDPVDVNVLGVTKWKNDATAAYSIIHDDACDWSTTGQQAHWNELSDRGLRAGFAAIVKSCEDNTDFDTWGWLKELVADGQQIINHSYTHPELGIDEAGVDLDVEIGTSTDKLESELGVKIDFFAFPLDESNQTLYDYLAGIDYMGSRGGARAVESADGTDDFKIAFDAYHATQTDISIYPTDPLKSHVDAAIGNGGWAVRELHGIEDTSWGTVALSEYTAHLDYVVGKIDAGEIWMDTPSTVLRYRGARMNCGEPTASGNVISFSPSSECERYATPLSVIVEPVDGSDIWAVQGGVEVPVQSYDSGQFLVDINPAAGDCEVFKK